MELVLQIVLCTQYYVFLPDPVFDAHSYPKVRAEWVLLNHFTDKEIEVNRV